MFMIWFTNIRNWGNDSYRGLSYAVNAAKKAGFECVIVDAEATKVVALWHPINGVEYV